MSEWDATAEDLDEEMMTKTDKLTMEMCSILTGTGASVKVDNYFMSTTTAIRLKENKIYCRGTIRSSRRFVPKSVIYNA
jgi:hypothetical protein